MWISYRIKFILLILLSQVTAFDKFVDVDLKGACTLLGDTCSILKNTGECGNASKPRAIFMLGPNYSQRCSIL